MTQYIDKSALVSEIKRIENELNYEIFTDECLGKRLVCNYIKSFLNTLEVKEVDLEKEFDKYCKDLCAIDIQEEPFTEMYNCAKYFYELGLAQKGE